MAYKYPCITILVYLITFTVYNLGKHAQVLHHQQTETLIMASVANISFFLSIFLFLSESHEIKQITTTVVWNILLLSSFSVEGEKGHIHNLA